MNASEKLEDHKKYSSKNGWKKIKSPLYSIVGSDSNINTKPMRGTDILSSEDAVYRQGTPSSKSCADHTYACFCLRVGSYFFNLLTISIVPKCHFTNREKNLFEEKWCGFFVLLFCLFCLFLFFTVTISVLISFMQVQNPHLCQLIFWFSSLRLISTATKSIMLNEVILNKKTQNSASFIETFHMLDQHYKRNETSLRPVIPDWK